MQALLSRARSGRTADAWARALRRFADFCRARPTIVWHAPTEDDFVAFIDDLTHQGLSPATIHRLWGDLRCGLELLDVRLPSGRRVELFRRGLAAIQPPPRPAPPAAAISRLLRAWRELPAGTPIQRRDRAVVLLALLLGARPGDVLKVGRDPDFLKMDDSDAIRLRLFQDKGSRLAGLSASRWLVLRDTSRLPVVDTVRAVIDDIPRERVRPFVDPAAVFFPLFVRYDSASFGSPLAPNTVSRILQRFLRRAGLPDGQARAHLIRSFAASAAYELGLDEQELCLHFRWASVNTFLRHYYLRGVERRLDRVPRGPRDGSRVSLVFDAALQRAEAE